MQTLNIFLGSSFHLMNYRKKLGETVRILNEKWLSKGVRIHLFIWEDFPPEYRGKSKQEEYIDEMVLKSEICIFLFSDSIGKFTKRELEAKLAHNPNAVYVYRVKAMVPKNNKKNCKEYTYIWEDKIKDELNKLCGVCNDLEDEIAAADELAKLVEEYIENNDLVNKTITPPHAWYFYTTIPEDNAGLRNEFGNVFRSLDDFFYSLYGTRCILHDRENAELLLKTDHYVPLMRDKLSDSDYQELETAVEIVNRQTERLRSLTFFKNGKIFPNEPRVKNLLENNEIFPVSYKSYESLKLKMQEWLLLENKRIIDSTTYVDTATKSIKVNNAVVAHFGDIETDSTLSKLADKVNRISSGIEIALQHEEEHKAIGLQVKYNVLNQQLTQKLNNQLNLWAFDKPRLLDNDQKNIETKINKLSFILSYRLSELTNKKQANAVLKLLEEKESLTRELVLMGFALPHRLLAVQMEEVGIYDTYLGQYKQPEGEDALYKRIIDDADMFGLLEPVAEMMRMNYANSLSRLKRIEDAAQYYKQAIFNLKKVKNKSKIVWHNITDVYMHLCNLYADNSMHQELGSAYVEFNDHIMELDFKEYCLDYCMFAALDIKIAPKYETDHKDKISNAIKSFDYALQELNLPINHQNYGEVFVHLPNWISAYFIDHCWDIPQKENIKECLENAEKYALVSLQNAEKLKKADYLMGLFSIGEALHQLGFIAAKDNSSQKAINYYNESFKSRQKLFKLTGLHEPTMAQTLVNKGAVLLESIFPTAVKERMNILNQALECAKSAKDIYKRYIIPGIEMTECNYYESLQLEGTIYYALWESTKEEEFFNKSIECCLICWKWNIQHPLNHYQNAFKNYSGEILRKHGYI